MPFVRNIIVKFIQNHFQDKKPAWSLFDKASQDHVESDQDREIVQILLNLADELEEFIKENYRSRFENLTEPLIPLLKSGSKQKFYDAFKSIADGLFTPSISWNHIVTFLVYNVELINKVHELPLLSEDKTSKMVLQIINSICRYFDESLTQWIDSQEGGWMSLVEYERERNSSSGKHDNNDVKGLRQYIGNMVAFAALIGGLYLCSKLTVQ